MPGPMGGGRRRGVNPTVKAKNFKGTAKKLFKNYLAQYKIKLLIVFLFAIGSTIFTIWKNCRNIINITRIIYNQYNILFCTRFYNDKCCTKINI